jgi:hypothetical protein
MRNRPTRSRWWSARVCGLMLMAVAGFALAGCGGGGSSGDKRSDGNDDADVLPPVASTIQQVHEFSYDTETGTYDVLGTTVTQDDVDRDLVGSLCGRCHTDAATELKDSVHYKIAGRTDRVMFPGGGAHGMLDRACGLPATTGLTNYLSDINLGECAKCHVGRYMPVMEGFFASMFQQMGLPDAQEQATNLIDAGLDCLICHAGEYRSHPEGQMAVLAGTATAEAHSPTVLGSARDARDNADFNHDGTPDLVLDMNGDGTPDAPLMFDSNGDGTPDTPWPTVAQDRGRGAIASIGKPTQEACLRCHEHARTGYKRGTLFIEGHDVHATLDTGVFANTENACTVCHTTSHHKFVRGHMVGGDLAAADYPAPAPGIPADPDDPTDLTCSGCHDPEDLEPVIHTRKHLDKISCETCHIPYASGITYSLFGHGGQVSFGRNADGKDTKLVAADMYMAGDHADLNADFEAYRARPILMWFNGGTSFLAQSLAVRGMPHTKITPFKPMANGMVFDARYFAGKTLTNAAGASYNAHSMYRFFANGNNAEVFAALDMLDMTPQAVREVTLAGFQSTDPDVQTMALMQIFPNLVYFDKAAFGYEHYMTRTGSAHDLNGDGLIDAGQDFNFDMFQAANGGLMQFAAFNGPMGFPRDYSWYPVFTTVDDVISMKLPDGSLIKMFLQMQGAALPTEQQAPFMEAVANYPSFSNITLGGHGVLAANKALGARSCGECHGEGGVLSTPHPVGRKVPVDMGPMGTFEMPVYQWKYYHLQNLVNLGLGATSEDVAAGIEDVDIDGDVTYVRAGDATFVLNWFMPNAPDGYRPAHDATSLAGTDLTADDLTTRGGKWMPVLEPVVDYKPNYEILGYRKSEIIWK